MPDTNSYGYSLAKKNLVIQGWAYREQYSFDSTVLLPANLYGPFDNFDLYSSHVVPALIRKFSEAVSNNLEKVSLWGSGTATREFLFAKDIVEAILRSVWVNKVGPFNVGTGIETSIQELAKIISQVTCYSGIVEWDSAMPDGQRRRFYDMTRLSSTYDWAPSTTLEDGLNITHRWYLDHYLNYSLLDIQSKPMLKGD